MQTMSIAQSVDTDGNFASIIREYIERTYGFDFDAGMSFA
jgi:hypothetical protein